MLLDLQHESDDDSDDDESSTDGSVTASGSDEVDSLSGNGPSSDDGSVSSLEHVGQGRLIRSLICGELVSFWFPFYSCLMVAGMLVPLFTDGS